MLRLFIASALRFWRQHWAQYSMLVVSLFIGLVGFALNDFFISNAKLQLSKTQQQIHYQGTHEIVSFKNNISPTLYSDLVIQLDVKNPVPIIEFSAELGEHRVQVIGLDVISFLSQQGANQGFSDIGTDFLTKKNAVITTDAVKQALTEHPFIINDKTIDLSVEAVLKQPFYEGSYFVMADIATVSEWLSQVALSKILITQPNLDLNTIQAIRALGLEVRSLDQTTSMMQDMTGSLFLSLKAASLITLLVSFALIYASMHLIQSEKKDTLYRFKTLGVSSLSLNMYLWLEIVILALILTLLTCLLVSVVGAPLQDRMNIVITQHYYNFSEFKPIMPWTTVVKTFALSILTLFMAFITTRRFTLKSHLILKVLAFLSALSLYGILLLIPAFEAMGGFIAFTAWLALLLMFTPWFCKLILSSIKTKRPILHLAVSHLNYRIRDLNIAMLSLTLTMTLILGLSIMIYSFRESLTLWLEQRLTADIYVNAQSDDRQIKAELEVLPGVKNVASYYNQTQWYQGRPFQLNAVELQQKDFAGYTLLKTKAIGADFIQGQGVLISETFSHKYQVSSNDMIELETPKGLQQVKVLDIYHNFTTEKGSLLMDASLYRQLYGEYNPQTFGIHVESKERMDELIKVLEKRFDRVYFPSDIMTLSIKVFDSTFSVLSAVQKLLVIVATLGLISTFLMLQMEQKGLSRMLKSLGLTRADILSYFTYQIGILFLLLLGISIPAGLWCGKNLLELVLARAFGWQIDYLIHGQEIAMITLSVFIFMMLAAFLSMVLFRSTSASLHD